MSEPRDKRRDPQPGDRVEHIDGGTMYVIGRTPKMVWINRSPDYTHRDRDAWMRLSTFQKVAR